MEEAINEFESSISNLHFGAMKLYVDSVKGKRTLEERYAERRYVLNAVQDRTRQIKQDILNSSIYIHIDKEVLGAELDKRATKANNNFVRELEKL